MYDSPKSSDPARRSAKRNALQDLLKQMHTLMAKGHAESAAPKSVEAEIIAAPKEEEEGPSELDEAGDSMEESEPSELEERKKAFFQGKKAPPAKGSMVVASVTKSSGKPHRFGKKG